MSGEPGPPSRVRRMLPSVSEVLKELTARASVEPDVAFRAAREVCAEELKRIRDAGGESVPLEELVQRAYRRVTGQSLPGPEPPAAQTEVVPVFDAAEEDPFAVPPPPPAAPAGDEPFLETSGALDLQWDEGREPLAAPPAAPLFLGEAAAPGGAGPAPTESLPVPFALPADEPPYPAAPVAEVFPSAPDESGPGDETLSRLSREAEAIELHDVFARPGAGEGAGKPSAHPEFREVTAGQPDVPPPFEDDEDTVLTVPRGGRKGDGRPRVGLVLGIVVGLAALAGLGYLLVGLWMERDATPTPVVVARPRAEKPAPPAPSPAAVAAPAEASGAEAGAPAATPVTAAVPPLPPAPVVPSPAPSRAPAASPAPSPTDPPPPAPVVAASPARAVPRSRDGLVVTRDRAGQPQVFSIHFTSYKDRPSAERDLKRVEAMAGMKGYVAEVDLGEKGVWQRVMVGAFATAEEAKAVRAELAAKGTRDMGWVYRVVGPDGVADR